MKNLINVSSVWSFACLDTVGTTQHVGQPTRRAISLYSANGRFGYAAEAVTTAATAATVAAALALVQKAAFKCFNQNAVD